jgi:hypothetical protein
MKLKDRLIFENISSLHDQTGWPMFKIWEKIFDCKNINESKLAIVIVCLTSFSGSAFLGCSAKIIYSGLIDSIRCSLLI